MFYIKNTYRYAMLLVDKFFPEASIIYYYITGSTEEDLRKQMNSLGPFDLNGKPWDAYTQWDTHWNWIGKNTPSYQLDKSVVLQRISNNDALATPMDDFVNIFVLDTVLSIILCLFLLYSSHFSLFFCIFSIATARQLFC